MNNSTFKCRSSAARICAVPIATLFALTAYASTNSWTEATNEIWSNDIICSYSPGKHQAEYFDVNQTALVTETPKLKPAALDVQASSGQITISGAGILTLNFIGLNLGVQTDEITIKAILACSIQAPPAKVNMLLRALNLSSQKDLRINNSSEFDLGSIKDRSLASANASVKNTTIGHLSGSFSSEIHSFHYFYGGAHVQQSLEKIKFNSNTPRGSNSLGSATNPSRSKSKVETHAEASLFDSTETDGSINETSQIASINDRLPKYYAVIPSSDSRQIPTTQNRATQTERLSNINNSNSTGIALYLAKSGILNVESEKNAITQTQGPSVIVPQTQSLIIPATVNSSILDQSITQKQIIHSSTTGYALNSPSITLQPSIQLTGLNGLQGSTTNTYSANFYNFSSQAKSNSVLAISGTIPVQQSGEIQTPTIKRAVAIVSPPNVQTDVIFESAGYKFLNFNGTIALSAGGPGNGDGIAVELGYYDSATAANNFAGNWIPLTGQTSKNIAYATSSIGDGGGADGEFFATYSFKSSQPDTFYDLPASNTILSLRFYESTDILNETPYNSVSNDSWLWQTPSTQDPFPPNLYPQVFMSLANSGIEWEKADSPFAVPEPTTSILLAVGAAGLLGRRRR